MVEKIQKKKIFLSVLLMGQFMMGQKTHPLVFSFEQGQVLKPSFYIDEVIDARTDKFLEADQNRNLGTPIRLVSEDSLGRLLFNYYKKTVQKENQANGIRVEIKKLQIFEKNKVDYMHALAIVEIEYYHKQTLLFRDEQQVKSLGKIVSKAHSKNVQEALNRSLIAFSNSPWQRGMKENGAAESSQVQGFDLVAQRSIRTRRGDPIQSLFSFGYQIGGHGLVGINYEEFLYDRVGFHFGVGYIGYTAGIKIHTNASKNSPYFNVNIKDGGFGKLNTCGIDFGGRIPLNKKTGFGLHLQICYAIIYHISYEFSNYLSQMEREKSNAFITFGAGFSW